VVGGERHGGDQEVSGDELRVGVLRWMVGFGELWECGRRQLEEQVEILTLNAMSISLEGQVVH
jgi:hypothetical protein